MSPRPSWLLRETERNPRHSHVSVFVGPDDEHRALAGTLVLDHEQADDLFRMLNPVAIDDVGVCTRVEITRAST